jgi:hypothetical protein
MAVSGMRFFIATKVLGGSGDSVWMLGWLDVTGLSLRSVFCEKYSKRLKETAFSQLGQEENT